MGKVFEEYDSEIELDRGFSQILLRINPPFTLALARKIIHNLDVQVLEVKSILPNILLLKLDIKDVRPVVLKLAENGFPDIKGFNAS